MRAWVIGWGMLGSVIACGPVVDPPVSSSDDSTTTPADGSSTTVTTGPGPVGTTPGSTTTPGSEVDVDDDGPRLDLPPDAGDDPPDCPLEWPPGGCGMPSARSTVSGTTPLGDFETTRAVFGSYGGCGGICDVDANVLQFVLLGPEVALDDFDVDTDETLVIDFLDPFEGPVGTPLVSFLYANRGGVTEHLEDAQVVVDLLPTPEELADPFAPRSAVVVSGSLTADAPGWSVSGTFVASYCPDLNSFAICE